MNTLPLVRVKLSSKKLREKFSKMTPKAAVVTNVTTADVARNSQKKVARKISKITPKAAVVTCVTTADVARII